MFIPKSAPWCYTTDPDKKWEECDCEPEDGMLFPIRLTRSSTFRHTDGFPIN